MPGVAQDYHVLGYHLMLLSGIQGVCLLRACLCPRTPAHPRRVAAKTQQIPLTEDSFVQTIAFSGSSASGSPESGLAANDHPWPRGIPGLVPLRILYYTCVMHCCVLSAGSASIVRVRVRVT